VVVNVFSQRSIRTYARPASAEEVDVVLRAARRAPTAAMVHAYSVIVITDPGTRRTLDEIGSRQKALRNSSLLLFCVDLRRIRRWGEILDRRVTYDGYTGLLFGAVDCTLAAANAIHAAASLGLGTCVVGTFFHRAYDVCEALDLPSGVLPLFGLTVGLAAESPPLRPRLPLEALVHENRYRDPSDAEVRRSWDVISTWSPGPEEVRRSADETLRFVQTIVSGSWWESGEEQLLAALARQGLGSRRPAAAHDGKAE